MGTVVLGYALNVTNDDVTRDQYDFVTDVSGLYSHSQARTFIDYNPASNYTGFTGLDKYDNDTATGYLTFKNFTGGNHTFVFEKATVTIDGITQDAMVFNPVSYHLQFINEKFYIQYTPTLDVNRLYIYGQDTNTHYNKITLNVSGNTISYDAITTSNINITGSVTTSNGNNLCYYSGSDWDYIQLRMYNNSLTDNMTAYYSDQYPIYSAGLIYGGDVILINENCYSLINNDFSSLNVYNQSDVNGTVYIVDNLKYGTAYETAIPRYVYYDVLGIDYTESNRANNYLVSNISGTQTGTVNLTSGMSNITRPLNYIRLSSGYNSNEYNMQIESSGNPPHITRMQYDYDVFTFYNPYCTNLTNVLNNISITPGATTIQITNKIGTPITTPVYDNYYDAALKNDCNAVWFYVPETPLYSDTTNPVFNGYLTDNDWTNTLGVNEKIVYDVTRQTADLYINDVKIGTYNPSDIKIMYGGSQVRQVVHYDSANPINSRFSITGSYATTFSPSITTVLNYSEYFEQTHYLDATKGVSVQNNQNVTWSNGYENSDIQILFRMEQMNTSYQNTITVGSDIITIKAEDNYFYVKINSNDWVNVGNWRNIVLDIDTNDGIVKALPVRTFNNYTNVVLYSGTDVLIGELSDRQTVSSIIIGATTNSFTFSIYNTKVFMNTYGAVMIDPSVNVNAYFTNLDDFYKITYKNFTLTGNSITVNGQTFNVVDGKINLVDDGYITSWEKLSDMEIIYKSGNTTMIFKDTGVTVNLGETTDYTISFSGRWYFESNLYSGSETTAKEYVWHYAEFVVNNGQFVVIYLGLLAVCFVVARMFCTFTVSDYVLMIVSIIIVLGVQII